MMINNGVHCLKIKKEQTRPDQHVAYARHGRSVRCFKLSPDRSATCDATGPKKRKIKVALSWRESALAAGTISLERSRSKSAAGDKRRERKEGNCRLSFHLTNFIARVSRKQAGITRVFQCGLLWPDVGNRKSELRCFF